MGDSRRPGDRKPPEPADGNAPAAAGPLDYARPDREPERREPSRFGRIVVAFVGEVFGQVVVPGLLLLLLIWLHTKGCIGHGR